MSGIKLVKYSAIAYLILNCMVGIVLVVSTSYIIVRRYSIRYFLEEYCAPILSTYSAPVLIFITTAVGWNTSRRNKAIGIKTASILMVLTIALELSLSVWCFATSQTMPKSLNRTMYDQLLYHNEEVNGDWWDTLQTDYHCCGVKGAVDYINKVNKVPGSCFSTQTIHPTGCLDVLKTEATEDFNIASLSLVIALVIQIPSVWLLWCFANKAQITPTTRDIDDFRTSTINRSTYEPLTGRFSYDRNPRIL